MSKYLNGHLLIATPAILDERFKRTVIFICSHDQNHAMGLVLNKISSEIDFEFLCKEMLLDSPINDLKKHIHIGGPMDTGRGFVLHTNDYTISESNIITDDFYMTCSTNIIEEIASGNGPKSSIITIGYAGWFSGQLELELKQNSWLTTQANASFIFETDPTDLWKKTLKIIGISPEQFSSQFGNA